MDRKFVIALSSLAGSMMLTEAHAIGLGDIKLRSALNEPLRADIKLVQVKDLSENEVLVNLAPKADFDRAGVDRDFLLTSLRFRLDLDDPKNPKVVVTTQQPIREPFLNFLIEVQWPSGRLLREYTLLMDLPAFADTGSVSSRSVASTKVAPGKALPADEGVSEVGASKSAPAPRVSAPKSENVRVRRATDEEIGDHGAESTTPVPEKKSAAVKPVEEREPTASAAEAAGSSPDSYGPTDSNDTLWSIAKSVRNGGTVHQNVVAIQRLNPEAFANGNINQLKKGQVLKLPSQEEIASIGRSEAVAVVNEQNNAWKSRKTETQPTGAQLDATAQAGQVAPAAPQQEGQLKLATPSDSTAGAAGQGSGDAASAEAAALQAELTVGTEELDRAQRENQELSSRVKDLDGQIESAERLLQLQNSEMAAMQAKLAAEQEAKAAAEAAVAAKTQADADAAAAAAAQATADAQAQAKAAADAAADAAAAQAAAEAQAQAEAAAQAAAADAQAKAAADAAAVQAAAEAQAKAEADAQAKAAADAAVQPAAVTPPAAEVPPAVTEVPAATESAPVVSEPVVSEPVVSEPVATPESKPEQVKKPEAVQPKQVIPPVPAEQPMFSPTVLGGIAAVIALLLGLFGYRKLSGRRQEESEEEAEDRGIDYEPAQSAVADVTAAAPIEAEAELELPVEAEIEPVVAEEPVEAAKPELGDVLGEADIYISFGNFDKGENLLNTAIAGEPGRSDYRLKLLELYKEADNLSAFDAAYKELIELDDDVATARAGEMRSRISGAAATPFAFGVSSAAAAAGISDEIDLDFDLDLDSAIAESAHDEVAVAEEAPAAVVEAEAALDLDFDLDLDTHAEPETTEAFDLDLSADFAETEMATAQEAASLATEDLDLDFDLDLETAAPAEMSVAVEEPVVVEVPAVAEENALLDVVTADAGEIDEELDFLSDADEAATKLDLARAYIDMGDKEGARDILAEVLEEGLDEQKREAQALLDGIG